MLKRTTNTIILSFCFYMLFVVWSPLHAEEKTKQEPPAEPVTISDPSIPVDELELLVKPLTADELFVEADAWLGLLKAKVAEISQAEIEVKKKHKEIKQSEVKLSIDEAKQALNEVETKEAKAQAEGTQEAAKDVTEAAKAASEAVDTVTETAEKTAEETAETKPEEKDQMLDITTELREERIALTDRLYVILDELNQKLGKTAAGTDNEKVVPYRLYGQSVSGIKVDISDTEAAYASIMGWFKSEEGGVRWVRNVGIFVATVVGFWIAGFLLSKLIERALRLAKLPSVLLRHFVVGAVRKAVVIIGVIVGLSAMEINIGPLLAVVGAAGFAIAFALQGTLSNFASGLMIMFYKPFDVGDVIEVEGLVGIVKSMSLVNTTITKFDNQVMIVPNNTIWGNTITNITGSEQRRVDLVFGISYSDDIDQAQKILEDIVSEHPLVLDEPEPTIKIDELADSSVNFICRPWVKTADFGPVRWDIIRAVKERFDQAGISIPFPQQDIHVYNTAAPTGAVSAQGQTKKAIEFQLQDEAVGTAKATADA
jgi:small conductance mechanosensitive channel